MGIPPLAATTKQNDSNGELRWRHTCLFSNVDPLELEH